MIGNMRVKVANLESGQRNDLTSIDVRLSQPEAAKMLNVSPRSVKTAKKVLKSKDAELINQVEAGEVSVHAALV